MKTTKSYQSNYVGTFIAVMANLLSEQNKEVIENTAEQPADSDNDENGN